MQHLQGPSGNYYDKYNAWNPISRWLVGQFLRRVGEFMRLTGAASVLDAGCGEGHVTGYVPLWLPGARVVGVDVAREVVDEAQARHPHLEFQLASVYALPFPNGSFDAVMMLEVLEHLECPELAMAEVTRVARRYCLLSVPREPLWRMTNMLRGAYLLTCGNTPGHINHWSNRSFIRFVSRWGTVVGVSRPFPWTMVLLELNR